MSNSEFDDMVERLQNALDPSTDRDETFSRADALVRLNREVRLGHDDDPIPFELANDEGVWFVEGETDSIPTGRNTSRRFIKKAVYVEPAAESSDIDGDECPECGYDRVERSYFDMGAGVDGSATTCRLCGATLAQHGP